jgi:predicted amidophosphoribosyltransferase
VCAYDGAGVALVAALKFRGERGVARWAASALVASPALADLDVATWLPTTRARRRQRGVDQAEVLARAIGRAGGVPVRSLLRRLPGPAQAGRSAVERRAGPAFDAVALAPGARVLLVDDVVTTGASASAAARALRSAGARGVVVACLARTPPGRHAPW